MAREEAIKVEGLRQLSRSLKAIDKDAPKGLRLAGNAAAQLIVDDAKPKVPLGPGAGGHARNSIKASSTRTAARVQGGGKRYPYYPWLDFGGRVGRGHNTLRPFLKTGRYIWRSFVDSRDRVQNELVSQLQKVANDAGLEVK